jgi:putative transposase
MSQAAVDFFVAECDWRIGVGGASWFRFETTTLTFCFWVAQRFQRCDKVVTKTRLKPPRYFMAAPLRGNTGHGIYFITASTFQRRPLFRKEPMARLFVEVLFHHREKRNYILQEFVLMPDHFHLLSPNVSLERSLQLIKGGFSYRAKREVEHSREVWQPSYYDRRVRDIEGYSNFGYYIRRNPVQRGLAETPEQYPYSSAHPGFALDEIPERLKLTLTA